MSLRVTEIYASIQGEASYAGYPCVFVRLTGCPLRCLWCDTTYGFEGGKDMTAQEIVAQVESYGLPLVELTGGEPLAQAEAIPLMRDLVAKPYKVLLETSGAEDISHVPKDVHIIMDIKCPGSQMQGKNHWPNVLHLKKSDEIKFVIANREDYEWAKMQIQEYALAHKAKLLMSCAFGLLAPKDLSAWLVEDRLNVRLNLQQHKYIWHPRAKGV